MKYMIMLCMTEVVCFGSSYYFTISHLKLYFGTQ